MGFGPLQLPNHSRPRPVAQIRAPMIFAVFNLVREIEVVFERFQKTEVNAILGLECFFVVFEVDEVLK